MVIMARCLLYVVVNNCWDTQCFAMVQVHAVIPLHTTPDETLTPSVTHLINVFGIATMRIYNTVLTGV